MHHALVVTERMVSSLNEIIVCLSTGDREGMRRWAEEKDGFAYLSVYLSLVLLALSAFGKNDSRMLF